MDPQQTLRLDPLKLFKWILNKTFNWIPSKLFIWFINIFFNKILNRMFNCIPNWTLHCIPNWTLHWIPNWTPDRESRTMTDVHSFSLELLQLWAADAKILFHQAESQLDIHNITAEQTKCHHILAALTAEIMVNLHYFSKMQYTVLKNHLLGIWTCIIHP